MSITNLNAQESCKRRTNQKQELEIKNEKKGKKQLSEFFNVPLQKNAETQCYRCTKTKTRMLMLQMQIAQKMCERRVLKHKADVADAYHTKTRRHRYIKAT